MAKIASCPIWGTRAEVQSGPDSVIVSSPRAGGKYQLTGSAERTVRELAVLRLRSPESASPCWSGLCPLLCGTAC
jgi:hypothetical protein